MKHKEPTDWKFVIGMFLLAAVLAALAVFFWKTVAREAEKEAFREAQERENAIRAIAVLQGDTLKRQVFVDMDTLEVFMAELPSEGIYNRNGVLIRSDVLEYGDMVRIYLEGEPSGDNPPRYEKTKKMERIGRADLETAQHFQEIADGLETDA